MKPYVFGVDIGGTAIKLGMFSTEGRLIEDWQITTRREKKGNYILDDIARAVKDKFVQKGIHDREIEGIGLGVPGPVGEDGTVFQCVNLGWDVFNVSKALSDLTGVPVRAGNDANVAALGEMWQGGGRGHQNLVMVTLGTGVGGGVVLNGRILAGANGAAGEIGHLPMIEGEPEACGCGKHGCLEQYGSANGLVRVAEKLLEKKAGFDSSLREKSPLTAKEICDSARMGDELASQALEQTASFLGRSLAMIACVVDPEIFVIGGGLAKASDILLPAISRYYRQYAFHASRNTPFVEAKLGNLAGIYGAARMMM